MCGKNKCLECEYYFVDSQYGISDCMNIGGCVLDEPIRYDWEDEFEESLGVVK